MKALSRHHLRRGFTILELLVAMAITTIIVTVLVGVTSVAIDTWSRSRSEVRAARQAKAAVDTFAKDLEALVTRKGNSFQWLYARTETDLPGPNSLKSSNAADLIFFTAATDRYEGKINTADDRGGDVSCVSWRLGYQDPLQGTNTNYSTFALYRLLVNPDETFNTLLGKTNLKSAFGANSAKVTDVGNFVCENVYQFTLTFNVEVQKTNSTTRILVPVTLGTASSQLKQFEVFGTGLVVASTPSSAVTLDELRAGRIASAQISLTVLSDFGVSQAKVRTFKSDAELAKFMSANSFQYSKVVELPGL
jgi:prepilin-type N-terminal cleavage/methylation domain-containing protein